MDTRRLFSLALRSFQAGDLAAAADLCAKALDFAPRDTAGLQLMGLTRMAQGRPDEAALWLAQAVALDSSLVEAQAGLGAALSATGKTTEALEPLRAALALEPGHAEALRHLADALHDLGQHAEAVEAYSELMRRHGPDAQSLANLAVVLLDLGRASEAEAACGQALALAPDLFQARNSLGLALLAQGRGAEAEAALRTATRQRPDHAGVWGNLGDALQATRKYEEAVRCYERAATLDPREPKLLVNQGNALAELGLTREAEASYGRALALRREAGALFRDALLLPRVMDSTEAMAQARERLGTRIDEAGASGLRLADPVSEVGATAFYLAYHGLDDRELQQRTARALLAACPELAWTAPGVEARMEPGGTRRGKKSRVGFVSAFFGAHTTSNYFAGLIERLPCPELEFRAYSLGGDGGAIWERLTQAVDRAVVVPPGLPAARKFLAAEELDALVFVELGMSPLAYFLSFARLAPLQCALYGHPDTSGAPNVDVFLSPGPMEPEGATAHYSERLAALPCLLSALPRPRPESGHCGNPFGQGRTNYLCTQSLFKIHPDFDGLVKRILEEDASGLLHLFAARIPALTRRMDERLRRTLGPLHKRVRWLEQVPHPRYLRIVAAADVLLDTPHFTGGSTSYEALGLGRPVVTLRGEFMRGRQTAALLEHVGVTGTLAETQEEYVAAALRLGRDTEWRGHLRRELDARRRLLFDPEPSVRALRAWLLKAVGAGRP